MGKTLGLLIGAFSSGCGKTVITCGLMKAFLRRGLKTAGFKCGPDYIDPMFHKEVLGIESKNLDGFFQTETMTRESFLAGAKDRDIGVIEGVMGYFDGIGDTGRASSYETAARLNCPVILVADGKKAGLSLAAAIRGFLEFDLPISGVSEISGRKHNGICGIIVNRVSLGRYPALKAMLENYLSVPVLGYVPEFNWLTIESRHLGLRLPGEIEDLKEQMERLAEEMEKTVEIERILSLVQENAITYDNIDSRLPSARHSTVSCRENAEKSVCQGGGTDPGFSGVFPNVYAYRNPRDRHIQDRHIQDRHIQDRHIQDRHIQDRHIQGAYPKLTVPVGIAMDEAFCFYYQDNFEELKKAGAELVFFSPLHHKTIPENVRGLLFGGGYPELYARQLSENTSMLRSVRQAADMGMPVLGECGGFLYLQEFLEDEKGILYPMAGVLPGKSRNAGKLGRFGYITLEGLSDTPYLKKGEKILAHEFHYWDSDCCGNVMEARKPAGSRNWRCMCRKNQVLAGFPHLYYPSFPQFAERFVQCCSAVKAAKEL